MTRITVRSTEREQILDITPQVRAFLLLGRWQEIDFMEFDGPREREVWLELIAG
jgi:thiamine phosphate synthase YjbQ (UPF0047 family)